MAANIVPYPATVFAHPLGLFALLGVPIVLGLHMYRRRFRPREVSALFLWVDQEDVPRAGRRRERLRSTASLWLELLVASLLALAFAGPLACSGQEAPHLVVVLDSSASMAATPPEGSTLDSALGAIRERVLASGKDARVTLIATGRHPRVLAGPSATASEALQKLEAFRPGTSSHAVEPALILAREIAADRGVLFVTDQHQSEAPYGEVEILSVGRPAENVGFVHATRRREQSPRKSPRKSPGKNSEQDAGATVDRALVTVQAFSNSVLTRTLTVSGPRGEIARRTLTLEPGRREHIAFDLPQDFPKVRVALLEQDALDLDNTVELVPDPKRVLRLACSLSGEEALALGLGREGAPMERLLAALPETLGSDPSSAHLILGKAPKGTGTAWSVEIHAGSKDERRDLIGPFLTDRQHPLLAGTTLQGIVWSIDPNLSLAGTPLVSAGDLPILTEVLDGSRSTFHFNLDPSRSTLARSPDWPILLANLVQMRREQLPGSSSVNIAAGAEFRFRGAGPGEYLAQRADGEELVTRTAQDLLVLDGLPGPGLYELFRLPRPGESSTIEAVPESIARFAIQFQDPQESDLRDRSSGTHPSSQASARLASTNHPFEALACALALVLLFWNWGLLRGHRRRTRSEVAR